MNSKTPDHQSGVFVCYPQRQIEYATSATAIAIPTVEPELPALTALRKAVLFPPESHLFHAVAPTVRLLLC
ncbi:hypothetical protein FSI07_023635, partial [Escherichia coli]|nr:hypothetical protein [Escherichia coli]